MANATETALLSYIFTAVAPSWAAATELDLHLHTADPGDAGTTATNEATYTSYALVTVDRPSLPRSPCNKTSRLPGFPSCLRPLTAPVSPALCSSAAPACSPYCSDPFALPKN